MFTRQITDGPQTQEIRTPLARRDSSAAKMAFCASSGVLVVYLWWSQR